MIMNCKTKRPLLNRWKVFFRSICSGEKDQKKSGLKTFLPLLSNFLDFFWNFSEFFRILWIFSIFVCNFFYFFWIFFKTFWNSHSEDWSLSLGKIQNHKFWIFENQFSKKNSIDFQIPKNRTLINCESSVLLEF